MKCKPVHAGIFPREKVVGFNKIVFEEAVEDPLGPEGQGVLLQDGVVLWRRLAVKGQAVVREAMRVEEFVEIVAGVLDEGVAKTDDVYRLAGPARRDCIGVIDEAEFVGGQGGEFGVGHPKDDVLFRCDISVPGETDRWIEL